MKRGQAALEFLMTYGWAILAVLVVVGALVYFSGGYSKIVPSQCTSGTPFVCEEYKISKNGSMILGLRNVGGNDLTVTNFTLYCNADRTAPVIFSMNAFVPVNARIGGSLLYITCPVSGSQYKGDFAFTYWNSGENYNHSQTGYIRSYVE